MTHRIAFMFFTLGLALAAPAMAQQTTAPVETPAETPAEPPVPAATDLSTGTPVETEIGQSYTRETQGDWEIRCLKVAEGPEPCQLYQLLKDSKGNAVAEINLFHLAETQTPVIAGATVITPLETLLTQQLTFSVDGSAPKRYPYAWCSQVGCFSRIGFSADEIAKLKSGNAAIIELVPAQAPDQKVALTVSLKGFTAAFAMVKLAAK